MDVAAILNGSFFSKKKATSHQRKLINDEFLLHAAAFLSQRKAPKGQMFFISAIFMIIGFVMLAGLLTLPEITQEKVFQETAYADKNLKNVRNEYEYLTGTATLQAAPNKTGADYIHNFSDFVRSNLNARVLYVFVFSNGTTNNFSATIGNFLQDKIDGNLSFTSGGSVVFSLDDKESSTYHFAGTNSVITGTLNYTILNTAVSEKFVFNDSSKNYAAAFFDITAAEDGFLVRSKSIYNRTW
jgi:hypothetical protein